jgi:hypothetical protein
MVGKRGLDILTGSFGDDIIRGGTGIPLMVIKASTSLEAEPAVTR